MREIKFRAWDNKVKEWLLGYEHSNLGGFSLFGECMLLGEWSHILNEFILQQRDRTPDDLIVMQYTGLKDKNGVEIYEGDIIAWDYEYDSDYDGDMPIVRRSTGKSVVKDIYDRSEIYRARQESKGCWVIGNIYENPELLGKDEEPRSGGMKKGKKEN